jgi:hypothetical protein
MVPRFAADFDIDTVVEPFVAPLTAVQIDTRE